MSIRFREADLSDLDLLLDLEGQGSARWTRKMFEDEMEIDFSRTILALDEEKPAGFIVVWLAPGEVQLNNISVAREHRRKGVALSLIHHVCDKDFHPGREKIILEAREDNLPALELYEKAGFARTGERPEYYGRTGAVLMEKRLP
jgi:ribosomal-protein-alanine N-acetyltransferase